MAKLNSRSPTVVPPLPAVRRSGKHACDARNVGACGAMPAAPAYRPDPQFATLGADFADRLSVASFPQAILRFPDDRAAATIGLDTLTDDEAISHFRRFEPLPGNMPQP